MVAGRQAVEAAVADARFRNAGGPGMRAGMARFGHGFLGELRELAAQMRRRNNRFYQSA